MKKRNGFVSNSSTSSFVVACKSKNTKGKITVEIDLKDYSDVIATIQELEQHIINNYGCYGDSDSLERILKDNEYCADMYKQSKTAIENGKIVLFGGFSNDGSIESYLCRTGLKTIISDDIEIFQDDEGHF